MKLFGLTILGLLAWACHTDSPVFTPAPGDYPCHRQDGSADPWAVSCRPQSATCCPENYRCEGTEWCEYMGRPNQMVVAAARIKQTPERP